MGVTDQHSQVQLYTEGPYDKVVTFIGVESFGDSVDIPADETADIGDFLKGHTLNELITAERKSTEFALTKAERSNFTILMPEVNAETIGELLMYFMYETAFAGARHRYVQSTRGGRGQKSYVRNDRSRGLRTEIARTRIRQEKRRIYN